MRRLCYYGRYMTSGHLIYMQHGTLKGPPRLLSQRRDRNALNFAS